MSKVLNYVKMWIILKMMKANNPENTMIAGAKIVRNKRGKQRSTLFYKVLTANLELIEEALYKGDMEPQEALEKLERVKNITKQQYSDLLDNDYHKDDFRSRAVEIDDFCLRVSYIMDSLPMFNSENEDYFVSNIKDLPEMKDRERIPVMSEEELSKYLV